jgi:hypothetical protein
MSLICSRKIFLDLPCTKLTTPLRYVCTVIALSWIVFVESKVSFNPSRKNTRLSAPSILYPCSNCQCPSCKPRQSGSATVFVSIKEVSQFLRPVLYCILLLTFPLYPVCTLRKLAHLDQSHSEPFRVCSAESRSVVLK